MFNLTLNGSLEFKLAFIIIYLLNETNSDRLILLFHVSHFLQFTNKENQQKSTDAWMRQDLTNYFIIFIISVK